MDTMLHQTFEWTRLDWTPNRYFVTVKETTECKNQPEQEEQESVQLHDQWNENLFLWLFDLSSLW